LSRASLFNNTNGAAVSLHNKKCSVSMIAATNLGFYELSYSMIMVFFYSKWSRFMIDSMNSGSGFQVIAVLIELMDAILSLS
jgi:hypothetical protein